MAARLGNVVYWMCSGLAALIILLLAYVVMSYGIGGARGDASFVQGLMFVVAVAIWLFGRAVRYVLGGK